MLKQIPKLLLLLALLIGFVLSSAPAFGSGQNGGCHFDKTTGQCVTLGCKHGCLNSGLGSCFCIHDWPI